MAQNINAIKGNVRAKGEDVLVSDMHFGEQTTSGGIIIGNDDGKTRGVYPRWAKVFSKGPNNKDEFEVGNWILVMHGRWTRGIKINVDNNDIEIRKVELTSILAYSEEKPNELQIGSEYSDGAHATIDPSAFVSPQY
tara:strand:- start:124 stop:534 length:411 start_codon:yes stop_codon:yes gene_type:complete